MLPGQGPEGVHMPSTELELLLPSYAERAAKSCESLPAFGGLNLIHIRRKVSQILGLIGRDGIFDQYTVHDISHIDKMLASLDWIIPDRTRPVMSSADWLMTTLAIYFHDLGMLVTSREFDARSSSGFVQYRDEVLFAGKDGADYEAKVATLGDRAERFLYQEWVRHTHAARIRSWVSGNYKQVLGVTSEVVEEIDALLAPLGTQFRRDLGLVCESHHLNDLDDLGKYKPSQPYGDSDSETVNLQYCAVLLRTADLLHMTSDRTPSTVFRVINPTDPISQDEWAKQMAVKRVRPKVAANEDGVADETLDKDTVEVHAYFTDESGFFGLTSYLAYATSELKRSNGWVSNVFKQNLAKHEFPWRRIDDTNIETVGFIRDSFEFTIDQAKILDLLTGHTLYNDTRVVLRELVQNSLDAIRLKCHPDSPGDRGKVRIHWDTSQRVLTVRDNGTGMSQHDISSFLLRVGTSRYQDPDFKKRYPGFSSISRFGIGVLSTFMIADSVEITTCHPDDAQARQLTLRSVHGKYLIQLLDKQDSKVEAVYPHGTEFRLRVRPSVKMPNVIDASKLWVVVPKCSVEVQVDNEVPRRVGFDSPAEALHALLSENGIKAEISTDNRAPGVTSGTRVVRVFQGTKDGVDLAFAAEWSEFFREWSFLPAASARARVEGEGPILGTCVEGIRIELDTPGYFGRPFYSLANVCGPGAPKTNVARSGLEATPERDAMLKDIYGLLTNHVANEARELQTDRSFSLTWAVEEARYLSQALQMRPPEYRSRPISTSSLEGKLCALDVLAVEEAGERKAISINALLQREKFWTIESALLRSAEPLIREAPTSASLTRLIAALNISGSFLPEDLVLCGLLSNDPFADLVYRSREVDRIIINHDLRRVDLRWVPANSRWSSLPDDLEPSRRRVQTRRTFDAGNAWSLLVGVDNIEVTPRASEIAIKVFNQWFVLPGTPVAKYLLDWHNRTKTSKSLDVSRCALFAHQAVLHCLALGRRISANTEEWIQRTMRIAETEYLTPGVFQATDLAELVALASSTSWTTFDPMAWRRQPIEPS